MAPLPRPPWVALPLRSLTGLLGMVVLVGIGEKMAERFLPIYLVALGAGPAIVGLLNALDNLLSALYSFPGGYFSDRFGVKRALLLFNLIAIVGFVIVIAVPRWEAVLVGAVFFLSWTAISLPASMSLVARVMPATRRTLGVSLHSLVRRIPMALGPVIGGLFIDHWGDRNGVRLAFVAALFMAILAIALQQALLPPDASTGGKAVPRHPIRVLRSLSPELHALLAADIFVRFCEQIPYAFVVLWCMRGIAHPVSGFGFGVLTAIEMATAAAVYLPVAYWADRTRKKPFVLVTFVFFTLFPLVLLFCQSFWPLVAAFVLRGLKEFGDATRKALIMDLAPADTKALAFGAYYLARDSIVSVAALLGGLLWMVSPATNFLTAFACGLVGTLWFALADRGRTSPSTPV